MTALFYCSANESIAPQYNEAARQAVRAACVAGYRISSGGTVKGTMRVVSEEALACGAFTKGVIPRFMEDLVYPGLSQTLWTSTMSERKAVMLEDADLVVALPGGIGTMDELFGTLVLAKLGRFSGRIAVLNVDGFYDPLLALLDHFVSEGMLSASERSLLLTPRTVKEFEGLL